MSDGRCKFCKDMEICPKCGQKIDYFKHVGVRATGAKGSSIWHYAQPCGHRIEFEEKTEALAALGKKLAVYNGGPLWKDGYSWVNVYWGMYWNGQPWVQMLDKATEDIEKSHSYSGGLKQYNVGTGNLKQSIVVPQDPPKVVSNTDIGNTINSWIKSGVLPDLQSKGAYNVFLPPGVTATLGVDSSCVTFCDYHDTANGNSGPFFTCEPYPCSTGCNQCDSNPVDTLTQGFSEEMVELKTDMNPGTGWVIGNEEICDYCDAHFVCNKITAGVYVNAYYSNEAGACWKSGP